MTRSVEQVCSHIYDFVGCLLFSIKSSLGDRNAPEKFLPLFKQTSPLLKKEKTLNIDHRPITRLLFYESANVNQCNKKSPFLIRQESRSKSTKRHAMLILLLGTRGGEEGCDQGIYRVEKIQTDYDIWLSEERDLLLEHRGGTAHISAPSTNCSGIVWFQRRPLKNRRSIGPQGKQYTRK